MKVLYAKPGNMCDSGSPTWWKERISCLKLSSDFYMCFVKHVQNPSPIFKEPLTQMCLVLGHEKLKGVVL